MSEIHELERISKIQDLSDLNDFMDDEDFGAALELALKVIAKPNPSPGSAREAMLKMQAWAFIFKMKGQAYMTVKKGAAGSAAVQKKNVYFSVSEQCNGLSVALRSLIREQF